MLTGHSPTSGLKGARNLLWKRHLTWEGELPDNLYRTEVQKVCTRVVRCCNQCREALELATSGLCDQSANGIGFFRLNAVGMPWTMQAVVLCPWYVASEAFCAHCRYGLPAFIALNPQQAKYAALREAFDVEHAAEFVERLRQASLWAALRILSSELLSAEGLTHRFFQQGFERVSSVDGSIPELETTDPWDGGEGVEVHEEEFSLEDLMKEEL